MIKVGYDSILELDQFKNINLTVGKTVHAECEKISAEIDENFNRGIIENIHYIRIKIEDQLKEPDADRDNFNSSNAI